MKVEMSRFKNGEKENPINVDAPQCAKQVIAAWEHPIQQYADCGEQSRDPSGR